MLRLVLTVALLLLALATPPATAARLVARRPAMRAGRTAAVLPDTPSTLASIMVFTRHGDRTPVHLLPADLNTWPAGRGQLTGRGMAQHVALGTSLRANYSALLGLDAYAVDDVYVRATAVDRTIQSAIALLSAFFPPGSGPPDSPGLYQYVPVHSRPVPSDILLRGYDNCPAFDALEDARARSPAFRAKAVEVAELLDTLRREGGEDSLELEDFYLAYDPIFCAWSHGRPLLNGKVTEAMFAEIVALADWVTAHVFSHDDAGKLAGGNMVVTLRDLAARIADPASADEHDPLGPGDLPGDLRKFYLLSAHDTTLASLLAALPIEYQGGIPPYASNVVFEFHVAPSGASYVTASFNGAPVVFTGDVCATTPPPGLDLVHGADACVLTTADFLAATANAFFPDWDAACGRAPDTVVVHDTASRSPAATFALVALVLVNVVGCAGGAVFIYRQQAASRYSRMVGADLFTADALAVLDGGGQRTRSSRSNPLPFATDSDASSGSGSLVFDERDQL